MAHEIGLDMERSKTTSPAKIAVLVGYVLAGGLGAAIITLGSPARDSRTLCETLGSN